MSKHTQTARTKKKPSKKKQDQPEFVSRRSQVLILSGLLLMMCLISYIPAYFAGYVEFDDQIYIRENLKVATGLRWDNVVWAFTEVGFASNWHPLTWLSHMLDAELFGVAPAGHHVVNVAIHALNAVLLFLMLRSLTGQIAASFVVAALFAVHPINVESVAWLAQRKNTLSTLFGILAIWSYGNYVRLRGWRPYVISLVMFGMSLLSKPMLVTLPFALLLLDYWPLLRPELRSQTSERSSSVMALLRGLVKLIPEKLPYLALSAGCILITLLAQKTAINPLEKYPLSDRLANVAVSYVDYLGFMFWPTKLAVFYPLDAAEIGVIHVLGAAAVLVVITGLVWWFRSAQPYLLVGWLWFLGTMVPVIGIVHVGSQALADRYAYLPFWGLWIALVWLAVDMINAFTKSRAARSTIAVLTGVLLALLCGMTYRQAAKWHDTVTLFESAVENTDKNWLAHRILANHYLAEEDYQRSIWHCQQTLQWGREYPMMYSTYGRALYAVGSHDEGLEKLRQAIVWYPEDALFRANLGWVLIDMGRFEEAAQQLEEASRLITAEATVYARRIVYGNWGIALAQLGQLEQGLEKLEVALSREPDNPDLLRDAARVDIRMQQYERARQRLIHLLKIMEFDVVAYELIANTFLAENNFKEAAATYQALINAVPNHYDARLNLSDLLIKMEYAEPAQQQLLSLVQELSIHDAPKVKSFLAQVHSKLAITYALKKDFENAQLSASQALQLAQQVENQQFIDEFSKQIEEYKQP